MLPNINKLLEGKNVFEQNRTLRRIQTLRIVLYHL